MQQPKLPTTDLKIYTFFKTHPQHGYTIQDIMTDIGYSRTTITIHLNKLVKQHLLVKQRMQGQLYYMFNESIGDLL